MTSVVFDGIPVLTAGKSLCCHVLAPIVKEIRYPCLHDDLWVNDAIRYCELRYETLLIYLIIITGFFAALPKNPFSALITLVRIV